VCDDPEISLKINNIVEAGAVGIKFGVHMPHHHDKVGGVSGFGTVDYLSDGEIKICRSMCRQIMLCDMSPFDKIDFAAIHMGDVRRYTRYQYTIIGCLALGLKLVMGNPALSLTPEELRGIDRLMGACERMRELHIECFGRIKDTWFEAFRRTYCMEDGDT